MLAVAKLLWMVVIVKVVRNCVFRFIVTAHSGIVTRDSGDRDRG